LGRVERTAGGARFAWPGTGFVVRFQGTGLTAKLKTTADDDYFQVVIDDKVTLLTTHAGESVYELAKGLTEGEHELTFWRRTETLAGVVEVKSIDVTNGALLSPPAPSGKLIEVVGDSITVGFGVDCGPEDGFSYATENNYQTYEAVAARALGAEVITLAWTGIGMLRDDDGQEETQMPERYLRTIATEATSRWSFDGSTPDAVVVALGTNDFATGDPGADYVSAYAKFLDDVRGRYPEARLYLAGSPMIDDGLVQYLTQLKNARSAQGDKNVAVIDFQPPAGDEGWGCGHPNAATHKIMAAKLEQALKADLGW
jgi:lysophospholipase L1-like esterase